MTAAQTAQTITTVNGIIEALLPVTGAVIAMVGGVPTPVTNDLKIAQALLPVIDQLILKIGTKEITLDTTGITTADQVKSILKADDAVAFPVLAFKNTP